MEGPVRSTSSTPTEWPAKDNDSASWVVTEDFPTPPFPESTWNVLVSRTGGDSKSAGRGGRSHQDDLLDFGERHGCALSRFHGDLGRKLDNGVGDLLKSYAERSLPKDVELVSVRWACWALNLCSLLLCTLTIAPLSVIIRTFLVALSACGELAAGHWRKVTTTGSFEMYVLKHYIIDIEDFLDAFHGRLGLLTYSVVLLRYFVDQLKDLLSFGPRKCGSRAKRPTRADASTPLVPFGFSATCRPMLPVNKRYIQ